MRMIQKDALSELRDEMQRMNNREGMNQYLLIIDSDDIIFSRDLIIINLLNSNYHGLDPYEFNLVINRAVELLREGTHPDMIDIVLEDGVICFKPKLINTFDTTNEFFLLTKRKSGFILKDIFETYFKDIDKIKLTNDIFLNPNASGLLSSDSNFIVYDSSDTISATVLSEYSRMFHRNRIISKNKLGIFILENILERDSRIDFITNDISEVIDRLFPHVVEELSKKVDSGEITERKAINCFKTNSVVGGVTMYNINRLNAINPKERPGYNIGLTPIFSKHK